MKNFLVFIGGITIGAGISWVYHKNKYEQMVQEEVEDLRNHMREKEENKVKPETMSADKEDESDNIINEDIMDPEEYEEHLTTNRYNTAFGDKEENMAEKFKKPFVVTPDEFATLTGFDTDTFYYHHDDIISNDRNEIVDDVEQILGLTTEEIRDQFGIYEDDAVYIRNMRLKCDYEILKENENYTIRNGD